MTNRIEVLDKGYVELQDFMGSDVDIVNAARVSVLGESKGDEKDRKLLAYLWKHQHTSPFEQCEFKFRVHAPLFVARQWMRHRTWCLAGDVEVTFNRPDRWAKGMHTKQTGSQPFTMKRLYDMWHNNHLRKRVKDMLIRVYDENNACFTVSHVTDVLYSGKQEVYLVETEDGKSLKCSAKHMILTSDGWTTLTDAIGLELTSNKTATMSKDCYVMTNGTKDVWRNYDWMAKQRQNGYSVSEIAENASCSYHNILKWIKIHGLQLTSEYKRIVKVTYIGVQETYDLSAGS